MPRPFFDHLRHFKMAEFRKDPLKADPDMVLLLDDIRDAAGVPLHIHVVWDEDGHSERSYHYTGQACDFHFGPGLTHLEEFALLSSFPQIGGMGFYPGWGPRPGWHIDLRAGGPRLLWAGGGEGVYFYGFRDFARAMALHGGA